MRHAHGEPGQDRGRSDNAKPLPERFGLRPDPGIFLDGGFSGLLPEFRSGFDRQGLGKLFDQSAEGRLDDLTGGRLGSGLEQGSKRAQEPGEVVRSSGFPQGLDRARRVRSRSGFDAPFFRLFLGCCAWERPKSAAVAMEAGRTPTPAAPRAAGMATDGASISPPS